MSKNVVITWITKRIRLKDLIEWDKNPVKISKHDADELAKSLDKYDRVLPYVAAAPPNGTKALPLLDGHQRKMVEIQINKTDPNTMVDVRIPSRQLTEQERKELVVRLRKNTGEFDFDKLAENFDTADLLNWGFTEQELKLEGFELDDEPQGAEPQIEEDRFEALAKKWKTKDGQLWQAGNHLIYCGDSLNIKSHEIVLHGNEPNLINADPPYGVNIVAANVTVGGGESEKGMIPFGGKKKRGYVGGGEGIKASPGFYPIEGRRRLRGTVGASKPFGSKAERGSDGAAHVVNAGKYPVIIGDENTETAIKSVLMCLEKYPSSNQVWWGANYYSQVLKPSPCWIIWNKETTGNFADCELAWSNSDMSAKLLTHRWNGMLRDSEREKRWHPTQKPAALAEWLCGLFTEEGDILFDLFGGAGWNLLAAERTKRIARIIEKSHEYVAVMLERASITFPGLEIKLLNNTWDDSNGKKKTRKK